MKITVFTILFTFVCFNITKARPVSYPGGLTLMLMNSAMKNSLHTHYSPTAKTSLGYKIEYWRGNEFTLNMIQMNNLIKRWNKPESQANFYLKSAIGAALGAIIFGTVSMGIFYTDVDTDWFKVFLGAMMLIAVVFNNYIRKKVTETK